MTDSFEEFWGEPISVYTDEDAVDDGMLVEINARDRVTAAAWAWIEGLAEKHAESGPPPGWAIPLMMWVGGEVARALATGLIEHNRAAATRIYEENIGGGIWTEEMHGATIWLIPNEVGGITAMFPEDY